MGLIINKKIPMLRKGYPTVSDKYNISGAVLAGTTPVGFGELVLKDTQTAEGCYFKAVGTTTVSAANIGGFTLATNVKVAQNWPGTTVQINPGEAFNLVVNGFLAVELASSLIEDLDDDAPQANAQVYFDNTNHVITTVSTSNFAIPNTVFTGVYEVVGGKLLAEIYVK